MSSSAEQLKAQLEALKALYYNPQYGLLSAEKLYKKLKSEGKEKWNKITLQKIKDFIAKQRVGQTYQRFQFKRKYRYPIRTWFNQESCFTRVMMDIMDVRNEIPRNNGGINYLLCALDVYTRYAIVIPLKTKTKKECMIAIQKILDEVNSIQDGRYKPTPGKYMELISDNESAWYCNLSYDEIKEEEEQGELKANDDPSTAKTCEFSAWLADENVHQTFVKNDYKKKSIVERFIRTLRWMIEKYLSAHQIKDNSYIGILPDIIKNYNTSYHSTLHTTPTEALIDNSYYEKHMWNKVMTLDNSIENRQSDLKVGDLVRKLLKKKHIKDSKKLDLGAFAKETQAWSDEIYKIVKAEKYLYYIKEEGAKDPLKTPFRRTELYKVSEEPEEMDEEEKKAEDEEEEEKKSEDNEEENEEEEKSSIRNNPSSHARKKERRIVKVKRAVKADIGTDPENNISSLSVLDNNIRARTRAGQNEIRRLKDYNRGIYY